MSETRFHIGDLLTVSTGLLLSPDGIGAVYKILNHMTGDNLFTHQLPRAGVECGPHILAQHPWLSEVDTSGITPENFKERLASIASLYGEWFDVEPIPEGEHRTIDPLAELAEMVDPSRIVVATSSTQTKGVDA